MLQICYSRLPRDAQDRAVGKAHALPGTELPHAWDALRRCQNSAAGSEASISHAFLPDEPEEEDVFLDKVGDAHPPVIRKKLTKPRLHLRDTVFSQLFSSEQGSRDLYLALHPEDKDILQDVKVVTKICTLGGGLRNDLALLVRCKGKPDRLILVESQTSWDPVMPFREVSYWVDEVQQEAEKLADLKTQRRFLQHLPVPELYCVYTKRTRNRPDTMRFDGHALGLPDSDLDINITVHMLYYEAGNDSMIN